MPGDSGATYDLVGFITIVCGQGITFSSDCRTDLFFSASWSFRKRELSPTMRPTLSISIQLLLDDHCLIWRTVAPVDRVSLL